MSEVDLEGAGLWQFPDYGIFKHDGHVLRPVLDVRRFKLPNGFGPRYRELMHESPLFVPALKSNFPVTPLPVAGRYQFPVQPTSATGGGATGDRCYFSPIPVAFTSITYDRLAVFLTSNGGAGTVFRLGMYQNDGTDSNPSTLIVDGGTVAGDAGAAAAKTVTISQKVTRGWWWTAGAVQASAGSPQWVMINPSLYFDGGHDSSGTFVRSQPYATQAGAFASAPAISLLGNTAQPMVGARIASYEQ